MARDLLKVLAACRPEGPILRARRARSGPEGPARGHEGPARASVARPLYLKLLTRYTIKPGTRQTIKLATRQTIKVATRQTIKLATRQTINLRLDRQ